MLLKLQKSNLQVQYKRGMKMHIVYFYSRTLTDNKGEEQKQQQEASAGQGDHNEILVMLNMLILEKFRIRESY